MPVSLEALAARLRLPLHRLESVSTFYTHFKREEPRGVEIEVCRDLSCQLAGRDRAPNRDDGQSAVALQELWRARSLARGREDALEANVVVTLGGHLTTSGFLQPATTILAGNAIRSSRPRPPAPVAPRSSSCGSSMPATAAP